MPRKGTAGLAIVAASLLLVTDASAQEQRDTVDMGPIFATVLDELRQEWVGGRVVLDRVLIDTTRRLAPPLLSMDELHEPERWARPQGVEVSRSSPPDQSLTGLWPGCEFGDPIATVAFAIPVLRGDTARLIVRHREASGALTCRRQTTVEEFTLTRGSDGWVIVTRRTRAVA